MLSILAAEDTGNDVIGKSDFSSVSMQFSLEWQQVLARLKLRMSTIASLRSFHALTRSRSPIRRVEKVTNRLTMAKPCKKSAGSAAAEILNRLIFPS